MHLSRDSNRNMKLAFFDLVTFDELDIGSPEVYDGTYTEVSKTRSDLIVYYYLFGAVITTGQFNHRSTTGQANHSCGVAPVTGVAGVAGGRDRSRVTSLSARMTGRRCLMDGGERQWREIGCVPRCMLYFMLVCPRSNNTSWRW